MSLDMLQTALVEWVSPRLNPVATTLGGTLPSAQNELPGITFSFEDCTQAPAGIGNNATSVMRGALSASSDIDLTDPFLYLKDDSVLLLSLDRLHLHLPHAPLVNAAGAEPSDPGDIEIRVDESPLTFLSDFTLDAQAGVLHFGAALPPNGTLHATYFVGQWEVQTEQIRGTLHVDIAGSTPATVEQLTTSLFAALRDHSIPGLRKLSPTRMTAINNGSFADSKARQLSYQFDYEYAYPLLPSGSGPIVRIEATTELPGSVGTEQLVIG